MKLLQANWIQPEEAENWLGSMVKGSCLNVCCGKSKIGDVRLDILPSPRSARTESGDMFKAKEKYGMESFDTVICDPPFKYYFHSKHWLWELSDMARKRLIVSSPLVTVSLGHNGSQWRKALYALESVRFLRLWWVFDRLDGRF